MYLGRDLAKQFFEHLYVRAPSLDKHGIHDLLTRDARDGQIQFRTVAEKFRLIDDSCLSNHSGALCRLTMRCSASWKKKARNAG